MASQFSEATQTVKDAVQSLEEADLRLLYAQYVARFLSDNSRIWLTASIMIPLALSGFALVSTIREPTFWRLFPVAIVSIAVILIWNYIAEHHRQFQDKSMAWIVAIEQLLIERSGATYPAFIKVGRPVFSVRIFRWLLLVIVIIAWVVVLAAWPPARG